MKALFWFGLFAAVLVAIAYFGYQFFLTDDDCPVKNTAGQCIQGGTGF